MNERDDQYLQTTTLVLHNHHHHHCSHLHFEFHGQQCLVIAWHGVACTSNANSGTLNPPHSQVTITLLAIIIESTCSIMARWRGHQSGWRVGAFVSYGHRHSIFLRKIIQCRTLRFGRVWWIWCRLFFCNDSKLYIKYIFFKNINNIFGQLLSDVDI